MTTLLLVSTYIVVKLSQFYIILKLVRRVKKESYVQLREIKSIWSDIRCDENCWTMLNVSFSMYVKVSLIFIIDDTMFNSFFSNIKILFTCVISIFAIVTSFNFDVNERKKNYNLLQPKVVMITVLTRFQIW
jgi:hypothetical protein